MSYYANSDQRARLITGLLDLADFLQANTEVPAPQYTDVLVFPSEVTDNGKRAEIDAIAERMGVEPRETEGGHYVAVRRFGPVQYRAVAIPHDNDTDGE